MLAKGDLQAAAELYKQALQEQPDDWAVLLLYLDCLLPATASTLPASASTGVAQMVTGVEASTQPGCQAGGLAALMAAMQVGERASWANSCCSVVQPACLHQAWRGAACCQEQVHTQSRVFAHACVHLC